MTGAAVDVVIVAFRSAALLPACLASVVGDPAVATVTVVDNESPDDSAAVADRHGARVVRPGANLGFGGGCNAGARDGSAPFVLLLNPDAAAEPGTVAGLAEALAARPAAAAVASHVASPDGRPEPVRRRFPAVWRAPLEPGLAARLDERHYRRRQPTGGPVDWLSAPCLLVRRAAFDAVGGFDDRYFLYAEETDLAARWAAAGWERHWVPGFPARHHSGASTSSLPGRGKVAWASGMARFADDHARHPGALRAGLALGLGARALAWRLRGRRDDAAAWWAAANAVRA